MIVLFIIAAAVAVFSTVMVITRMHAVHALLYLIVSLLSVSVVFFLLGAPFAGILEIIVYAGAIMVLFLFVVMTLAVGKDSVDAERRMLPARMWIGPAVLTLILFTELLYLLIPGMPGSIAAGSVGPKEVGVSLFTTYLLGVELAAFLLLAGIVGAYHLGRRASKTRHRFLTEEEAS